MPKAASEKQRTANQKNAKKSTGPKTPAGKTKAARNALKHGLLAREVVITGHDLTERRADFDAFLADLCTELQPRGLIEETLVERIATCYWRLRRVQRFEVGAIRGTLDTADPNAPQRAELRRKLTDAQRALDTEFRLAALLDKPADQRTPRESQDLERSLPDFQRAYGLPQPDDAALSLEERVRRALPRIIQPMQARVDALGAQLHAAENEQALRAERRPFIASLPERDALHSVVRYENMLDRQIHRAIAELRRRRKVPTHSTTKKN